jgi:hypothetical protein
MPRSKSKQKVRKHRNKQRHKRRMDRKKAARAEALRR